jgi:hypothetical protein
MVIEQIGTDECGVRGFRLGVAGVGDREEPPQSVRLVAVVFHGVEQPLELAGQ